MASSCLYSAELSSVTFVVREQVVQSLCVVNDLVAEQSDTNDLVAEQSDTSWLLLLTGACIMQTGVLQTADIVTANL